MNSIMHEVNGLAVPQRQEDGYVNATKLCKAAGKRYRRGVQLARIYPDELLPMFRRWLRAAYIPGQFPGYVCQLYSPEECGMELGRSAMM